MALHKFALSVFNADHITNSLKFLYTSFISKLGKISTSSGRLVMLPLKLVTLRIVMFVLVE